MRDFRSLVHTLVLEPALSEQEISQLRTATDPWAALAYLVYRASQGDFSGIGQIEASMRSYSNSTSTPCAFSASSCGLPLAAA